jgi:hypothetical protein
MRGEQPLTGKAGCEGASLKRREAAGEESRQPLGDVSAPMTSKDREAAQCLQPLVGKTVGGRQVEQPPDPLANQAMLPGAADRLPAGEADHGQLERREQRRLAGLLEQVLGLTSLAWAK